MEKSGWVSDEVWWGLSVSTGSSSDRVTCSKSHSKQRAELGMGEEAGSEVRVTLSTPHLHGPGRVEWNWQFEKRRMFLCKLEVLSIEVKANTGEAMDALISRERVSHWGVSGRGKSTARQPAGEGLET